LAASQIDRKQGEIEESARAHTALDGFYKALTTQVPRQLLSRVQLPVDNLEIKGDDVLVGGISIETLSNSEQIKFAINIARTLAVVLFTMWYTARRLRRNGEEEG